MWWKWWVWQRMLDELLSEDRLLFGLRSTGKRMEAHSNLHPPA